MPERFTTLKAGNHVFEFDLSTRELRLAGTDEQTFLSSEETSALRDFLVEVLSTHESASHEQKQTDQASQEEQMVKTYTSGLTGQAEHKFRKEATRLAHVGWRVQSQSATTHPWTGKAHTVTVVYVREPATR